MECKFKVCLHSSYIRKRKDLVHLKQFIFLHVKMITWAGFLFPHFSSLEPKKRWNRFSSISALLSLPDSVCKFSSFILTGEWEKERENIHFLILPPLVSHLALSTLNFSDFLIFLSSINIVFYQSFLFIVFHLLFICLQFVCLSKSIWLVLCHTFCPIHSSLISFPTPPFLPPSFPPSPSLSFLPLLFCFSFLLSSILYLSSSQLLR